MALGVESLRWLIVCSVLLVTLHESCAVNSTRLLVLGDWGGVDVVPYKTIVEVSVAKQMGIVADQYAPQNILALGDNFYFDGVKDVTDKRFKETFEDVYTSPSLKIPWHVIAGNHDHHGNVSAQIAYSNVDKRWHFPNYYYKMSMSVPGGATMDIIMIDTVLLCGNTGMDEEGAQPKGPSNVKVADDQWAWISSMLQLSTADFLLVAGHYPVYSIAEHGPTDCLVKQLLPLLQKYRVTAYLSGHDHNLQHLEMVTPGLTTDMFVVGAANFVDTSTEHSQSVPKGSSKFMWAKPLDLGGFAYIETVKNNMTFTFVDGRGQSIYQKVLFPRKK
ncbi:tartrate-resistant acid phosphatase type 5-like [Mizuhopecten yessoensis]|uniref:Tartrate-resistant acid phosphatase type 5 n=1 Tax=Mizuhopecten yessoensis TaxID=6573 RepID=A0A210Q7Q5_MIZYE|nr:tartrate-resistant acid phosphatase type 5-like [Mizuhopecten yessoensis]OWF44778.1 Tartrate-resistant acid phosphatase type 5 [Mizuhopecten yessoensis]